MKALASFSVVVILLVAACGDEGPNPECKDVQASDFDEQSGWETDDYCDVPTDRGCFPFHESAEDTCGPFISMRTSATEESAVDACESIFSAINCGTYTGEAGELSFFVEDPDRLTVRMFGNVDGLGEVDTTLYFNPCQPSCLAAVSLETLNPTRQKICEIPRQGKPACLFDEAAQSLTIDRAGADAVILTVADEKQTFSRDGQ